MPCFHPLTAYRGRINAATGKCSIVFSPSQSLTRISIQLPCGQCIGCRLARSKQWAIRCVHEAQQHKQNSFITLTYNDTNIPHDGSLNVQHFQKFIKRLRFHYAGKNIRYYHCGEYGPKLKRPHYHACLFGIDFADKTPWQTINGQILYRSPTLEKLWPYGYSSIGTVTFDSAAYVARYILKKQNGEKASYHYVNHDPITGEIYNDLSPEYTSMSLKPGIGSAWYEKYKTEVYPSDFVTHKGREFQPPKFYDKKLEIENPTLYDEIKLQRKVNALKYHKDNTPDRLAVRETCKKQQINLLVRPYENETTNVYDL